MFFKKKPQVFAKSITIINTYTKRYSKSVDDKLLPLTLDAIDHKSTNNFTSYINNKDFIHTTVSLNVDEEENDIAQILEIKAYEELDLDHRKEYVVAFTEIENDIEEDRKFHLFVVDKEKLNSIFAPIQKQVKYLDLIVPAPLLYKSLYQRKILNLNEVHCFIYFSKEDTFITFYQNTEFLYAKSIAFSLDEIYDNFCKTKKVSIDKKEFYSLLKEKGFNPIDNEYYQDFITIFIEIFMSINDIIIYVKREFKLEHIDYVMVGCDEGEIVGLKEHCKRYLALDVVNFPKNEISSNQFDMMMLLSTYDYKVDKKSLANVTKFFKPPRFIHRASGQFIMIVSIAILLAAIYPLFYLLGTYKNERDIKMFKEEKNKLQAISIKHKRIITHKEKEITHLDKDIVKSKKEYEEKVNLLTQIYNKKVNYTLKSDMFYILAKTLSKFDVNIDMISSYNNRILLLLSSKSDRKLTELIKYITTTYVDKINKITINRIEKDLNSRDYKGLLRIELK